MNKRKFEPSSSHHISQNIIQLSSSSSSSKVHTISSDTIPINNNHVTTSQKHGNEPKIQKVSNTSFEADSNKILRHQYPVDRVLSKLLVDNPLSISSLVTILPDIPKDVIQATLDTLQVLDFVIRVKPISPNTDNTHYYTIKDYMKGLDIDLLRMSEETSHKLSSTVRNNHRIALLRVNSISSLYFTIFLKIYTSLC